MSYELWRDRAATLLGYDLSASRGVNDLQFPIPGGGEVRVEDPRFASDGTPINAASVIRRHSGGAIEAATFGTKYEESLPVRWLEKYFWDPKTGTRQRMSARYRSGALRNAAPFGLVYERHGLRGQVTRVTAALSRAGVALTCGDQTLDVPFPRGSRLPVDIDLPGVIAEKVADEAGVRGVWKFGRYQRLFAGLADRAAARMPMDFPELDQLWIQLKSGAKICGLEWAQFRNAGVIILGVSLAAGLALFRERMSVSASA